MVRKWLLRIFLILAIFSALALACIAYIRISTDQYLFTDLAQVPETQAVMILGAGIKANGELSAVLKDRVVNAINLYKAGRAKKIIVSGNNQKVVTRSDDEVTPVREFLVKEGIPAEDIFTDREGFDTYTSMAHAKDQFGIASLIISTQQFHLARAIYLARSFGIEAYGVSADAGTYQDRNYIREYIAQPKAVFEVLIHRSVEMENRTYSITGNGQESWQ